VTSPTTPSLDTRNEPAEKLRENLHAIGGSGDDVFALLDAALSEERRRTVERIRERLTEDAFGQDDRMEWFDADATVAILDELSR
jgi:hypothetical protein